MSVFKKLKEHSDTAGEFWKKFFRCFFCIVGHLIGKHSERLQPLISSIFDRSKLKCFLKIIKRFQIYLTEQSLWCILMAKE